MIGRRKLQLVFEVRHRANAPNDHVSLSSLHITDEQVAEAVDLDIRQVSGDLLEQRLTLFDGEQLVLARIVQNGDDQLVELLRRTMDDIQMAIGDRIKAAGIDGN